MNEPRRSPEELLARIREEEARAGRGRLKIFFGANPGVGKTFAMLSEGRRLKERGVDVVIGYVEPHERPETTAQIGDLEIVPPRLTQYHGITLKEMDVDAVIARKPTVALVDELAVASARRSPGPTGRRGSRCRLPRLDPASRATPRGL